MYRSLQGKTNIDYTIKKYRNRLSKELKDKSDPTSEPKEFHDELIHWVNGLNSTCGSKAVKNTTKWASEVRHWMGGQSLRSVATRASLFQTSWLGAHIVCATGAHQQ